MPKGLLAVLALVGLAAHARCSVPASPDSCGPREGGACEAGDHSLIQVVSRPSANHRKSSRDGHRRVPASGSSTSAPATKKKAELLARSRAQSRESPPATVGKNGVVGNQTIANITASLKADLEQLESYVNLMALGRHKLCAAEEKNAERVKALMHLLKLQVLLQSSPLEAPRQRRDSLEAMQKADQDGPWCPSWFPGCGPTQESPPVVTVVSDAANTVKKHDDNRTLDNISADIGTEETSVRNIMDDIRHEGDRLEVLAKATGERVSVLMALLSKESEQCETSGEYSYGGMLQAGKLSHEPRQRANMTEQSVLQAATQNAEKRMSRADIQMLLGGPFTADMNMTFINLTNTITNATSKLVSDVDALILQKNNLNVASQANAGSIDNLQDDLKGQNSAGAPLASSPPVELVLQIGQAINSRNVQPAPAAPADQQALAADDVQQAPAAPVVPPAAAVSATSQAGNATTTAELQAKDAKKQEGAEDVAAANARADEAEKRAAESRRLAAAEAEEIKKLKSDTAKKATEQAQAEPAKVNLAIEDIPVINLTWAVDKHVVSLETDVGMMAEQRHEVCWVTKNTADRLTVIHQILTTVKC